MMRQRTNDENHIIHYKEKKTEDKKTQDQEEKPCSQTNKLIVFSFQFLRFYSKYNFYVQILHSTSVSLYLCLAHTFLTLISPRKTHAQL